MREARNGREGIACCQKDTVALVLTDLLMPEQEGLETIQQLRTMTPAPKIIAISGGIHRTARLPEGRRVGR